MAACEGLLSQKDGEEMKEKQSVSSGPIQYDLYKRHAPYVRCKMLCLLNPLSLIQETLSQDQLFSS